MTTNKLQDFAPLTVDRQEKVMEQALEQFLGEEPIYQEPAPEQLDENEFKAAETARFPTWFNHFVGLGAVMVFLASFLVSSYRVFLVSAAFVDGLPWYQQGGAIGVPDTFYIVGLDTRFSLIAFVTGLLMAIGAEFALTIFQLYIAILSDSANRTGKSMKFEIGVMWAATFLAIVFAGTMNWAYIRPDLHTSQAIDFMKALVETFIPIMFVVGLGFALKSRLLADLNLKAQIDAEYEDEMVRIKSEHKAAVQEAQNSYKNLLDDYQQKQRNPWDFPEFVNLLGRQVWLAFQEVYRTRGIYDLSSNERKQLVINQIRSMQPPELADLVQFANRKEDAQQQEVLKKGVKLEEVEIWQNENGWFFTHELLTEGRPYGSRGKTDKGYKSRSAAESKAKQLIEENK